MSSDNTTTNNNTTDNTFWTRARKGSKAGFDKVWSALDKLGAPVNRLSNKLGSEAFWPTTLDKESDKAARILRSFCKDGFYQDEDVKPVDGPKQKQKVLKKIPKETIEKAVGLCIFTTMRTGLWLSGSGGSGVLVARQEDGSWSPPSGILLHTAGLGFLVGVDIYDCVIVINNRKALAGFTNVRLTLGGEISAVAGPTGMGGIVDSEVHARQAPLFTYMKSRGLYAGVQVDGTIIIERTDENERFYGEKLTAQEIVSGKVRHVPLEVRRLRETLKSAEGIAQVDETLIPDEKPPGDYDIEGSPHVFGVPDQEDPDPYGVRALEDVGMGIREAGTRAKPDEEEFEFKPVLTSPVHTTFQPAIEAARGRRNTVTSPQTSPRIGTTSEQPSASSSRVALDKLAPEPVAEEEPPAVVAIATKEAPAPKHDGDLGEEEAALGGDITEERTDAEHFENTTTTTITARKMSGRSSKSEEAPVESDLAAMSLDRNAAAEAKKSADIDREA